MQDYERNTVTFAVDKEAYQEKASALYHFIRNEPGASLSVTATGDGKRLFRVGYYPVMSADTLAQIPLLAGVKESALKLPEDQGWQTFDVTLRNPFDRLGWTAAFELLKTNATSELPADFFTNMQEMAVQEHVSFAVSLEFNRPDPEDLSFITRMIDGELKRQQEFEHGFRVITDQDPLSTKVLVSILMTLWVTDIRIHLQDGDITFARELASNIGSLLHIPEVNLSHGTPGRLINTTSFTSEEHFLSPSTVLPRLLPNSRVLMLLAALDPRNESKVALLSRNHFLIEKRGRNSRRNDGVTLGKTERFRLFLPDSAREHHLWCIGQTGTGKTTLLSRLIMSDIKAGKKVLVLDAHGELARSVWSMIPQNRRDEATFLAFDDYDSPPSLDVLAWNTSLPDGRDRAIRNLCDIVQGYWTDDPNITGPVFQSLFTKALVCLMENREAGAEVSIDDMHRLFTQQSFLEDAIDNCHTPEVKDYWTNYLMDMSNLKEKHDMSNYVSSKLSAFTQTEIARKILGCGNPFDYQSFVSPHGNTKILIVSMNRAKIGTATAAFAGQVLLFNIRTSWMSIEPRESEACFAYIDELQNFVSGTDIESLLSELRKWKVRLCLANQYARQLTSRVVDSILGNVGNIICMRVGLGDAELLKDVLGESLAKEVINFPNYTGIARLCVEDHPSTPIRFKTFGPLKSQHANQ